MTLLRASLMLNHWSVAEDHVRAFSISQRFGRVTIHTPHTSKFLADPTVVIQTQSNLF